MISLSPDQIIMLLRAQLTAEGCICDPSIELTVEGVNTLAGFHIGHDAECPRLNQPATILKVNELSKEPS